uniref:Wingless n=1 Tax=Romanomermis culicivorax TaxID=13658 RepID=A0A915HS55_ROMCU
MVKAILRPVPGLADRPTGKKSLPSPTRNDGFHEGKHLDFRTNRNFPRKNGVGGRRFRAGTQKWSDHLGGKVWGNKSRHSGAETF